MERTETDRVYDITVVGATGFAGSLVAEYLFERLEASQFTLALAGRSMDRLESLRDRLTASDPDSATPPAPQLVHVNLLDQNSVDALVHKTRVVVATAGPYSRYGSLLVASCATYGTHYVDLSGETPWMQRMIRQHDQQARANGACIVHACGYDSIPSDLGVLFLRDVMASDDRGEPEAIRFVPGRTEGGFSGGTVASMLSMFADARKDAGTREALRDPDSLTPDQHSSQRSRRRRYDPWLREWTVPFVMEAVNSRIVRRTNALTGYPLGTDPDYREVIRFGRGIAACIKSYAASFGMGLFLLLLLFPPTRFLLSRFILPKPGEGPKVAREGGGSFLVRLIGYSSSHGSSAPGAAPARTIGSTTITVSADRDPGYGATAIMVAETAMLLCGQAETNSVSAGFQTPATAFGLPLVERLTSAGVKFVRG
ncbi:MAG: saccharopine dehydrogenase [Spirochaetaceae bacterium]|nr:MAG: saccharopine dehydrogenase [Spirochaetaceae bacterium]